MLKALKESENDPPEPGNINYKYIFRKCDHLNYM